MTRTAAAASQARGFERAEERLERHLTLLMAARLALASASLGIALALDRLGGNLTLQEWHGFYATVVIAFVATLVYRPFVGRIRRPRLFAAVNIATDIGLVSALVLFSGGRESVFIFLYVVVAIYASLLFQRFGALASGALAALAYGAVLLAGWSGWVSTARDAQNVIILATTWVVHAGALILVSALSAFLVAELDRAGRALHEKSSALVALQTLHERTVESLMSGLLTTDLSGRVTSFNREAERITGIPRAHALGLDVEAVLPYVRKLIEASEEEIQRARARMPYRSPDGRDLHLGVGTYVLRDATGQPSGHVLIFQDVSAVVEMERELSRSERLAAIGQLSASIAHEIRNPLAAISGAIQVLREQPAGETGESKQLMDIVEREIDRLNRLITDFLQFARPGPHNPEPVHLAAIVSEVLEMFEAMRAADVRIETSIDQRLGVHADAERLRQVLWNLMLNGAEAMPRGGRLRIEASGIRGGEAQEAATGDRSDGESKAGFTEIAVMDQGSGIAADVAERIFDPFFTTRSKGSGLGLATVHRIVVEHGGTIRFERGRAPWSTVFRVRLPSAELA